MLPGERILLIDDNRPIVAILKCHLENIGYKVFTAHDGEEGLKQFYQSNPDLVILDMNMPLKSGVEFYNDIMASGYKKLTPIIAFTSRVEFEKMFEDLGIDGFISKADCTTQKLDEAVEQALLKYGKEKPKKNPKSVLTIEQDKTTLENIKGVFERADFTVKAVQGMEELKPETPPKTYNLILANFTFSEFIPDLRQKLKLIAENDPVLLYTPKSRILPGANPRKICERPGIAPAEIELTDEPVYLLKKSMEMIGARPQPAPETAAATPGAVPPSPAKPEAPKAPPAKK